MTTSYRYIAWDPETTIVFAYGSSEEEVREKISYLPEEYDTTGIIIEEAPLNYIWILTEEYGIQTAKLIEIKK